MVYHKIINHKKEKCTYLKTKIDDSMNGNAVIFYEAIKSIESYVLKGNQLKFYYTLFTF